VKVPEIQAEAKKPEVKEVAQGSDLKKKLDELVALAQNLQKLGNEEILEVLGADNDKLSVLYQFSVDEGNISITKTETDKISDVESTDNLAFIYDADNASVQILLDDVLLFDEVEHLTEDMKKKMQVTEKFNKFIFLLGEQVKKLEKESKEKEAEEMERRRLQDVFRNF
ncbi:hypothetical protein KKH82_04035, partial [Patescibacteria group bacterium]|nr:hypothetical protein [Patescibacteria group bacterium]